MRKFKCISLVEKERFGWRSYFDLGGEYELVNEYPRLQLRSDKGHKGAWNVDRDCFEEVFEEVKPVRKFRIKEGAAILHYTDHKHGEVYELDEVGNAGVYLKCNDGKADWYDSFEVEEVFEDNLYVNDLTADVITFLNDNFEMFVLYCGGCETRASLSIDFIERKGEGKV